jgi:uncharacterized protein YdcH (DUF465 family)
MEQQTKHEKHDLRHEFPQHEERIHELKIENNHFRKLFDDYHHVNKDIHRLESTETYTDDELNRLRKRRLHLKDELLNMIVNQ